MTPATIRVAFDSGWTKGDPGEGRLRFDTPKLAKASSICINSRCAQTGQLDDLIPNWKLGDVIVIERSGQEDNRVVAWVIGSIDHGGSFWRVPIAVRSVYGSFAAHDELLLHHHGNVADVGDVAFPVASVAKPAQLALPTPPEGPPMAPMAPAQVDVLQGPPQLPVAPLSAPIRKPLPLAPIAPTDTDELARLRAENQRLQSIVSLLISDETELYLVEGTH